MGVAVELITLAGCELTIGGYPPFRYDATGGGAIGTAEQCADQSWRLRFPVEAINIPALNYRTGRLLGLPLPPGLQIAIEPEALEGTAHPVRGELELHFKARFRLQLAIASTVIYTAPPLWVETQLSTKALSSQRHQLQGRASREGATALLVGVALVPRCGAAWLDRFLGLPDEALAALECQLNLNP